MQFANNLFLGALGWPINSRDISHVINLFSGLAILISFTMSICLLVRERTRKIPIAVV